MSLVQLLLQSIFAFIFLFVPPSLAQTVPAEFCFEIAVGPTVTLKSEQNFANVRAVTETVREVVISSDDLVVVRRAITVSSSFSTTVTVTNSIYQKDNGDWLVEIETVPDDKTANIAPVTIKSMTSYTQPYAPNCIEAGVTTMVNHQETPNGKFRTITTIDRMFSGIETHDVLGEPQEVLVVIETRVKKSGLINSFDTNAFQLPASRVVKYYHETYGVVYISSEVDGIDGSSIKNENNLVSVSGF